MLQGLHKILGHNQMEVLTSVPPPEEVVTIGTPCDRLYSVDQSNIQPRTPHSPHSRM